MKIDDMTPTNSAFLKKEDVGQEGVNLTIKGFKQEMVGQGPDAEQKWVIVWTNTNFKPMVLNKENGSRLKVICKTDDTDNMIGATVNVYEDPYVAFGGKTVGGLRLRSATGKSAPRSAPAEDHEDPGHGMEKPDFNDDIPF